MIEAWRRVLVLAPHTDDGEFGCGGTIARLIEGGVEVRYVAFSIATKSLPPPTSEVTIRTGCVGYVCADAMLAPTSRQAADSPSTLKRDIHSSLMRAKGGGRHFEPPCNRFVT